MPAALSAIASVAPLAPLGTFWPATPCGWAPQGLDSALFGPLGGFGLGAAALGLWGGGLCSSAGALLPLREVGTPPVPTAAPLHILGLLGAGLGDLASDHRTALPPLLGLGAIGLGGLWSRRVAPSRELWSWDAVELAAADLLLADTCADHLWAARPAPAGALWGGAELRLFRVGLVASHHHLAATGLYPPLAPWGRTSAYAVAGGGAFALVAYPPSAAPGLPPLRSPSAPAASGGAPTTPGEVALAAWAGGLWAPASAALALGNTGAPLSYLWSAAAVLALYLGPGRPHLPVGRGEVHLPLLPLAHAFAAPLPWGLTLLGPLNQYGKPVPLLSDVVPPPMPVFRRYGLHVGRSEAVPARHSCHP